MEIVFPMVVFSFYCWLSAQTLDKYYLFLSIRLFVHVICICISHLHADNVKCDCTVLLTSHAIWDRLVFRVLFPLWDIQTGRTKEMEKTIAESRREEERVHENVLEFRCGWFCSSKIHCNGIKYSNNEWYTSIPYTYKSDHQLPHRMKKKEIVETEAQHVQCAYGLNANRINISDDRIICAFYSLSLLDFPYDVESFGKKIFRKACFQE